MLQKLERKLGRFAIPNLTLFLVAGQTGSFVLSRAKPAFASQLVLIPEAVLDGEWWRLISFLFLHPSDNIIFVFFALYLLYMMGSALEATWGAFRYNVFILVGWIASIGAAFSVPGAYATNVYLMGSVFLAFAWLNPNYQLLLFFILPIRIKWLALLTWIAYVVMAVIGDWQDRALIGAGVANFFLFFGRDIVARIKQGRRTAAKTTRARAERRERDKPFHTCAKCGVTDKDDPEMQFRYCPQCKGSPGYCMDHIRDHEHVA